VPVSKASNHIQNVFGLTFSDSSLKSRPIYNSGGANQFIQLLYTYPCIWFKLFKEL